MEHPGRLNSVSSLSHDNRQFTNLFVIAFFVHPIILFAANILLLSFVKLSLLCFVGINFKVCIPFSFLGKLNPLLYLVIIIFKFDTPFSLGLLDSTLSLTSPNLCLNQLGAFFNGCTGKSFFGLK